MTSLVSVVICTRNRAKALRATLEAMNGVTLPANVSGELLIVDNGSEDDTGAVVRSASIASMPIRYVVERARGLSNARNRALAEARGSVILFTDDDVRPLPGWVEAICLPLIAGTADGVQGGVRIPPHLRCPWMQRFHLELLASTEYMDGEVPYFVGANMAFGRHVLEKIPGFDPALGAGALGFLDESLFFMQMKEVGYRFIFARDATVEHHFDASRLSAANFRDRALREGRSRAYVAHHWQHESHPDAERKLATTRRAFLKHRIRHLWGLWPSRVVDQGEFWLYVSLGYWQQMVIERKNPRRYGRYGLALLGPESDETEPFRSVPAGEKCS